MDYSLDYYYAQKRRTENEIANRRTRNDKLRREIRQLEDAYQQLGRIKRTNPQNALSVRENAKLSHVANSVEWRGDSKKKFDDIMKNAVPRAARDFYDSIDAMQDEVGRALDRKRGEYDTGIRTLNSLNRTLNNIAGIIRNWGN